MLYNIQFEILIIAECELREYYYDALCPFGCNTTCEGGYNFPRKIQVLCSYSLISLLTLDDEFEELNIIGYFAIVGELYIEDSLLFVCENVSDAELLLILLNTQRIEGSTLVFYLR